MASRPNGARVPALMLQGTGSDVGKSLLAAGLGRAFTRRGLRVRPFKPQNMSNNAALADDGRGGIGEIGRAQALQARACGVAPSCDMNPVLLKPQSEIGAQVVIQGRVVGNAAAEEWRTRRTQYLPFVLESFARIGTDADLVIVEGAGSPAEANLRDGDIANMGFAEAADVPVVLVGDIDRGGVLASLIGTWVLLSESERARTKGYIVNKFRGDPKLFADGPPIVARHTGLRCYGVVPHLRAAGALPQEDAATLEGGTLGGRKGEGAIRVAVPRLPRIANFDDLDPLAAESDVEVAIVPAGRPLPADADVVLIPGSKSTLADLAALRAEGWDIDVAAHVRRGGTVVGLCGGFQMLGTRIADPAGIEGPPGEASGLGLLAVATTMEGEKALRPAKGRDALSGAPVAGYEMHIGRTEGPGLSRPWLVLEGERAEGAISPDGRVLGCYVHGLFADDQFRAAFLARLREGRSSPASFEAGVDAALDTLAAALETHLDLDALLAAARR